MDTMNATVISIEGPRVTFDVDGRYHLSGTSADGGRPGQGEGGQITVANGGFAFQFDGFSGTYSYRFPRADGDWVCEGPNANSTEDTFAHHYIVVRRRGTRMQRQGPAIMARGPITDTNTGFRFDDGVQAYVYQE